MMDVVRNRLGTCLIRRNGEIIGEIRRGDGEIMLFKGIMDELSDQELLGLMKIGMKPAMWYGKANSDDSGDVES